MSKKSPICAVAIRNLVTAFHTRVRRDHVLAPIFARAVGTSDAEWETYIAQVEEFCSSMMLTGREAKPRPLQARLPDLEPALLERWLLLFGGTCNDLFEPEMAAAFQHRATGIAADLRAAKAS
jgi:hemoglobin